MDNDLNPAYYPGESRGTVSQSTLDRGNGRIVIPAELNDVGSLIDKPTISNDSNIYNLYHIDETIKKTSNDNSQFSKLNIGIIIKIGIIILCISIFLFIIINTLLLLFVI